MRSLVFATALLLLVPMGMADHGPENHGAGQGQQGPAQNETAPGNASAAPCREADDRRACMKDVCENDPDARGCPQFAACRGPDCAALSPACHRTDNRSAKACAELQQLDDIRIQARHVSFEVEADGRQLLNYSVGDRLLAQSITYGRSNESFEVSQQGARIQFQSQDARLEIHDTPTGEFWFRGAANDTIVVVLPNDVSTSQAPGGLLVDYGDRTARIAGEGLSVEGQTVTGSPYLSFFAPSGRGPAAAADALAEAKASQQVGAEIKMRGQIAEITAYDDVAINITMPALIKGNDTLRVRLDANLSEGRTFIIDIDPAQLGGTELELRYYDVRGDTETEVVFHQADSLADILDPTDDGGQPEYWVVEDADGLHVMVSVPVWSVHVIELASIGEFLIQPSVLLGVAAGVMGVAVAGTAMFWPRRVEEEF